jgi:hypothetical protein
LKVLMEKTALRALRVKKAKTVFKGPPGKTV